MNVRNVFIAALLVWTPLSVLAQEDEEDEFYRDPDAEEETDSEEEGEETDDSVSEEDETENRLPFRGSSFSYTNAMSAATQTFLSQEAGFYYGMSYSFQPRYNFTDWFNIRLRLELEQELTASDYTTYEREPLLSDLMLYFYFSDVLKSVTDFVSLSTYFRLQFPTSKRSQARTLILGGTLGLSASVTIPVLEGIRLGYSISGTKYFNEQSTGIYESPLIRCSYNSDASCEALLSTGLPNNGWLLSNSLSLMFSPIENLTLSVIVSFSDYWAGETAETTYADVGVEGVDPSEVIESRPDDTRRRSGIMYVVELGYQVTPYLGLAIGSSTMNMQLDGRSQYETPFFNEYTQIYFNISLSIDEIVNSIRNRRTERSEANRPADEA